MQAQPATERIWLALCWVLTLLLLGWLTIQTVTTASQMPERPIGQRLIDFDAFVIVGQLAQEGRGAAAYDLDTMITIQARELGEEGVMPWTYPPPYHLIGMALAALPRGLAYGGFVALSALAWLGILAMLAGRQLPVVALALMPAIGVSAALGQNGFLIGALLGACCWLMLRRAGGAAAGLPLGLLILKPHLGLGLGLLVLATGRWRVLATATATALALCLAATLVLGSGIWVAFLEGVRTTGRLLDGGGYPLYRMVSIHALARTLGLDTGPAGWVQAGAALTACAGLVWYLRRKPPLRHALAAACFLPTLISPYFFDYDMLSAGIGLALLMPELAARSGLAARLLLVILTWLASGWGVLTIFRAAALDQSERFAQIWLSPAIGAVAWLALLALILRILASPQARVP